MIRAIVNGACGRMGGEVIKLLHEGYMGSSLAAAVDSFSIDADIYDDLNKVDCEADVIIDFSNHAAVKGLLEYAQRVKTPVVVATTGHTEEEEEMITAASKNIAVFFSSNMSIGVALLVQLAKQAAKLFPDADIEIVEKHHNRKLDAPSGTALMIADGIRSIRKDAVYKFGRSGQQKREEREIGIHALRMGNVVGEHEVIIATDAQTISLKHEAHSRALFAEGAIAAANFLKDKPAGLYNMQDIIR